mgnify:CR=1 FL=1
MSNVIPFRYQGQPVRFNADGWINATEAAKRFGKEPHEWLRLPETKSYLSAMAKSGIFPELTRTARGRSGGTWLHPKLAVAFARWLSADFAVWCDLQIDALIHGDVPAQQQFNRACKALADGHAAASISGQKLAEWRWRKPGLAREVEHWREQLQMTLALDAS